MSLIRVAPKGVDLWQCSACGVIGSYDEVREVECTYEYPPCEYCGQTPECAPDCEGITKALSDPNVYVAGFFDGKEH